MLNPLNIIYLTIFLVFLLLLANLVRGGTWVLTAVTLLLWGMTSFGPHTQNISNNSTVN